MSRPIHVLELRSVWGTGGGPEKTILLGAARSDPARVRVTVCYIRDARDPGFGIDRRAKDLGVDYVEVIERHSFDPSIGAALHRIIREREIDIVHSHDYKTNLAALLLARTAGVIPLSTVHGWTGQSGREKFLYYPADKRLLAWFPRVIAVSGQISAELQRAGARRGRIRTILNGIDPQANRRDGARRAEVRAELGLAPGDIVVGSVGRVEAQKRFDLLLKAVAILRPSRPELRLVIVGDGTLKRALEQQLASLGLDGVARFLGQRSDVARIHHALDLFVQSSDYEGSANAVLEAMAMETPLVATTAGGTSELVEADVHGVLVAPGSAEELAHAIDRVLCDPAASARRVAAARGRVERELSFDARMAAVERVYEELMALREDRQKQKRGLRCA